MVGVSCGMTPAVQLESLIRLCFALTLVLARVGSPRLAVAVTWGRRMKRVSGIWLAMFIITTGACTLAAAGTKGGFQHYVDHEFDEAIESCKGGKDVTARLVLGLSHTERYNIYKDKTDKERAGMYIDLLEVDVTLEHAAVIRTFLNVKGNQNGNKVALALLKKSFANTKSVPEHMLLIASFVTPDQSVDVRKAALYVISRRLGPVRDYVSKGGSMPKEMKDRVFTNVQLLNPVVDALSEKATASAARKCLVLIEEPALKYLEDRELTKPISDTIVSIKKAMARRKKKHPDSTWYSAYSE